MKRERITLLGAALTLGAFLAGCGTPSESPEESAVPADQSSESYSETVSESREEATELLVRFGDEGTDFVMQLENNDTAAAIARYVGTSEWRLPIYSYDESDVMQYYDIPSRYEIPDGSEPVTHAQAGDVFYSDPNRIILYYHDADISEEYTRIGTFDATDEFIAAVENNPVLEGWGNKIVIISDGE